MTAVADVVDNANDKLSRPVTPGCGHICGLVVPSIHDDPIRPRGLCDAFDHLLGHQIADPVHELQDLLLSVLQADLAFVHPR